MKRRKRKARESALPTNPVVTRGLLRRGGLGPTVGAVLMRTPCVGGAPRICDARVVRGVVHHAAVVRVPLML